VFDASGLPCLRTSTDGYNRAREINGWKTEFDVRKHPACGRPTVRTASACRGIKPLRDEIEVSAGKWCTTLLEEFHYATRL